MNMKKESAIRLQQEFEELRDRSVKLATFMMTDEFKNLDSLERFLLGRQKDLMYQYGQVLQERIKSNPYI